MKRDGFLTYWWGCLILVVVVAWPVGFLHGPLKLLEIPWLAVLAALWFGLYTSAQARQRANRQAARRR